MFLDRLPAELSGGQQQRVALARALAKGAPLMLLDEPLVNLDYKLREELREELTQLFAAGDSTVIYATTEPAEALLLGGYTAVLDAGELLQYGPTAEVFHRAGLAARGARLQRPADEPAAGAGAARRRAAATAARCWRLRLPPAAGAEADRRACAPARALSERDPATSRWQAGWSWPRFPAPTPSCTCDTAVGELVAQLTGVHDFELGGAITLYLNPAQIYVFDAAGGLLLAPRTAGER